MKTGDIGITAEATSMLLPLTRDESVNLIQFLKFTYCKGCFISISFMKAIAF
jgi:hypothetical protein